MKTTLIFIASVFILCACTSEEICPPDTGTQTAMVDISFTEEAEGTRAFFDNTATAEAWEKSLSSVTIYVFSSSGDIIAERLFTSGEVTAKTASMALPLSVAGTTCEFYALANAKITGINKKSDLTSKLENQAAGYNGTFANVSTKSVRSGGFVMTGNTSKAVGAAGTSTSVAITLKRTVAKIAVQTTVDASFSQKYGGSLTIKSVKLSKAAVQTKYFYESTLSTGAMTYTHSQPPGTASDKYNSLFYIYENGNLAAGSRVLLEITATYDADGNSSTTNDQKEVTYQMELAGTSSTGKIDRNGYYRVAINITGLAGDEVKMSVSVAEWQTPTTQNISIGL